MSTIGSTARRRLLLGGAAAALLVGAAAAPAAASPTVFPVGGADAAGAGATRASVLTGARSAFEALPDRDRIPLDQIMKNMDRGFMW